MLKIMVIDDNRPFRESLIDFLRRYFSSTAFEGAASSEEALLKSSRFSPQLFFVDIQLPNENGLQLVKMLRPQYGDAIIAVLTDHDGPEYRQEATRCGADFFISKDGTPLDNIIHVVQTATDGFALVDAGG